MRQGQTRNLGRRETPARMQQWLGLRNARDRRLAGKAGRRDWPAQGTTGTSISEPLRYSGNGLQFAMSAQRRPLVPTLSSMALWTNASGRSWRSQPASVISTRYIPLRKDNLLRPCYRLNRSSKSLDCGIFCKGRQHTCHCFRPGVTSRCDRLSVGVESADDAALIRAMRARDCSE
jgi:hypothetical protein